MGDKRGRGSISGSVEPCGSAVQAWRAEQPCRPDLSCQQPRSLGENSSPRLPDRQETLLPRCPRRDFRRALGYVLLNARRHLAKSRGVSRSTTAHLDGASSARWFDGWRPEAVSRIPIASGASEVARPRTWLLRVGWRRHGLVDPAEVPGETVREHGDR